MNGSWHYVMEDRSLRGQDLARRISEREGTVLPPRRRSSLRARMARGLFELAVAAEREETWRVVWERLEARGRL